MGGFTDFLGGGGGAAPKSSAASQSGVTASYGADLAALQPTLTVVSIVIGVLGLVFLILKNK